MSTLPSRGDRVALWLILAGAAAFSALTVVFGLLHGIGLFVSGQAAVTLLTASELPADVSALVVAGEFSHATVVAELSAGARALLGTGALLATLTSLAVSLPIAYLCWSLLHRAPFRRSLFIAVLAAGAALSIGSTLHQAVTGFGQMMAGAELGAPFLVGFEFDPVPILGGFAVLALALAFQIGQRMQRDTEGLV